VADDIVKRLRSEMHYRPDSAVIAAAADLIEAQQAEIERLTQHSVILNRVSWQLHDALGMVPEGADSYWADIEATLPTICQIIKEALRG
jgi:hypothetical protein